MLKQISQIYKIKNTVCIQFHPEVTVELFDKWYESEVSKKELKNYDVELTRNKLINYENSMNQKLIVFKNGKTPRLFFFISSK